MCGGELGDWERDRDTWKELAVSDDTWMVRGIPSTLHLPPTGAFRTRDTAPTVLFQLPCLRLFTCLFPPHVLSRPISGHAGLPLQSSFPSPYQFSKPLTSLSPHINAFSSPPLRSLLSQPGPPSPCPVLTPSPPHPPPSAPFPSDAAFPSSASRRSPALTRYGRAAACCAP